MPIPADIRTAVLDLLREPEVSTEYDQRLNTLYDRILNRLVRETDLFAEREVIPTLKADLMKILVVNCSWPTSFASCCVTVGLDPEWIRKAILERVAQIETGVCAPKVRIGVGRRTPMTDTDETRHRVKKVA